MLMQAMGGMQVRQARAPQGTATLPSSLCA